MSLEIDGATILDHVDLAIADGGITVLVGPSGAGKSTLLRLLNRLEVPTAGEVRFRGRPLADLDSSALRRRVGMVFQRPAPFPGTVRDNLLVADPDADEEALVAALHAARLDAAFLDRPADELSGGEAQRMCLARTLVTQPEVLLMDEPTSALDPDARRRLERTALRLADEGRELVWVTHDLEQAAPPRLARSWCWSAGASRARPTGRGSWPTSCPPTCRGTPATGTEVTTMDDAAIGWGGLALSLILVAVAVGLSMWQGLRLERDMLWATGAGARPAAGRGLRPRCSSSTTTRPWSGPGPGSS